MHPRICLKLFIVAVMAISQLPSSLSRSASFRQTIEDDSLTYGCSCPYNDTMKIISSLKRAPLYHLLDDFEEYHPCTTKSLFGPDMFRTECESTNILARVTYLIMTGSINHRNRYEKQVLETWASKPFIRNRTIAVSDKGDEALGIETLEELAGKTSYDDAQHRQLKYISKKMLTHRLWSSTDWLVLADDDTFINTDKLHRFLRKFDPRLPLAFGHVFAEGTNYNSPVGRRTIFGWFSGGGGIMLSRSIVEYLAENLYTSVCPFDVYNDKTLGECIRTRPGAILVHCPYLTPFRFDLKNTFYRHNLAVVRDSIAIHYMDDMHALYDCLNLLDSNSDKILAKC